MYSSRINELRCTQEHLAGWPQTPVAPARYPLDLTTTTTAGCLSPKIRRETLDRVRVVREGALVVGVPSQLRYGAATLAAQFVLTQPSGGMLEPLDVVGGGRGSESRYHV
jgi:glucose-6-phosphate dehydrogenase assembly protein OpcA